MCTMFLTWLSFFFQPWGNWLGTWLLSITVAVCSCRECCFYNCITFLFYFALLVFVASDFNNFHDHVSVLDLICACVIAFKLLGFDGTYVLIFILFHCKHVYNTMLCSLKYHGNYYGWMSSSSWRVASYHFFICTSSLSKAFWSICAY